MKELRFSTSKGEFLMVDMPLDVDKIAYGIGGVKIKQGNDKKWTSFLSAKCELVNTLKHITEEQASEIVDDYKKWFKNYSYKEDAVGGQRVSIVVFPYHKKAIDSLFSLLDSKGIHLFENPIEIGTSKEDYEIYKNSEQKTFYNPYIFKI